MTKPLNIARNGKGFYQRVSLLLLLLLLLLIIMIIIAIIITILIIKYILSLYI